MTKKDNDNPTAKQLVKQADAMIEAGVTKRDEYLKALPLMMSMREAAISLKGYVKNLEDRSDEIERLTAAYALEHSTALDVPMHEESGKKQCGSVTIGKEVYTLTLTRGRLRRPNNDNMTKDFLARLPAEWIKTKPELDVTGINRLGVSEEVLFKHGLIREEKRVWTSKKAEALNG